MERVEGRPGAAVIRSDTVDRSPFDLTGKVAFLTGAGRGIGRAIADALAEAGADVAVNALSPTYVMPAVEEIERARGTRAIAVLGDVTQPASSNAMVERVERELGPIDILVNNLGDSMAKPLVPLPDRPDAMTDDDVRFMLDVNLVGALTCVRAVGPGLIERRQGKVINISAAAARRGGANAVYTLAKTGLVGFTRALAIEWAPYGIQVNAIAPGSFPHPLSHSPEVIARVTEEAVRSVPAGRVGQQREVGLLARYLAVVGR